jgi:predicted XRE-type DNA-binding protein
MTEKPTIRPDARVVAASEPVEVPGPGRDWRELGPDEDDFAANLEFLMGRLRSERKRLGLTQKTVAERMQVSQSRVSALETGSLRKTEIGAIAKYFRALGVKVPLDRVKISLNPEIRGEA